MGVGLAANPVYPESPVESNASGAGIDYNPGVTNEFPGQAVTQLRLSNYRNIKSLRLESQARAVALMGPNGSGKTNILEALSFLSPGRGLRRARLSQVTRRGSDDLWGISAEIRERQRVIKIGTGLSISDRGIERRLVKVDGRPARGISALGSAVALNWLTPLMDRLFVEGAGPRRRFLDRLVYGLDNEHASRVLRYDRALRERSRLLRTGGGDDTWLKALEEVMVTSGVAIAVARRDTIRYLASALEVTKSPFPSALVKADGDVEFWLDDMTAKDAESKFSNALELSRSRDSKTGGAAVGPHRTDFAVHHVEKDMPAADCSTGEQKALLISIVLADCHIQEMRLNRAPLLLFDEVAAHLDQARRQSLFELISERSGQTWVTGTDAHLFRELSDVAQFFDIEDGCLSVRHH